MERKFFNFEVSPGEKEDSPEVLRQKNLEEYANELATRVRQLSPDMVKVVELVAGSDSKEDCDLRLFVLQIRDAKDVPGAIELLKGQDARHRVYLETTVDRAQEYFDYMRYGAQKIRGDAGLKMLQEIDGFGEGYFGKKDFVEVKKELRGKMAVFFQKVKETRNDSEVVDVFVGPDGRQNVPLGLFEQALWRSTLDFLIPAETRRDFILYCLSDISVKKIVRNIMSPRLASMSPGMRDRFMDEKYIKYAESELKNFIEMVRRSSNYTDNRDLGDLSDFFITKARNLDIVWWALHNWVANKVGGE